MQVATIAPPMGIEDRCREHFAGWALTPSQAAAASHPSTLGLLPLGLPPIAPMHPCRVGGGMPLVGMWVGLSGRCNDAGWCSVWWPAKLPPPEPQEGRS